jgi:hypothetical protein
MSSGELLIGMIVFSLSVGQGLARIARAIKEKPLVNIDADTVALSGNINVAKVSSNAAHQGGEGER